MAPKWIADPAKLSGPEVDKACELMDIEFTEFETMLAKKPFTVMAVAAMLHAQRTDPSIPDDAYQTLPLQDITIVEGKDVTVRKPVDPTSPGSGTGSTSRKRSASARAKSTTARKKN